MDPSDSQLSSNNKIFLFLINFKILLNSFEFPHTFTAKINFVFCYSFSEFGNVKI